MAVKMPLGLRIAIIDRVFRRKMDEWAEEIGITAVQLRVCLLYTSPSPRD